MHSHFWNFTTLTIFIKFVRTYSVMVRGNIVKNKGSGIIWPGLNSSLTSCVTLIKVLYFLCLSLHICKMGIIPHKVLWRPSDFLAYGKQSINISYYFSYYFLFLALDFSTTICFQFLWVHPTLRIYKIAIEKDTIEIFGRRERRIDVRLG